MRNIGFFFPSISLLTQYRRQKAYNNAAKDLVLEKKKTKQKTDGGYNDTDQ